MISFLLVVSLLIVPAAAVDRDVPDGRWRRAAAADSRRRRRGMFPDLIVVVGLFVIDRDLHCLAEFRELLDGWPGLWHVDGELSGSETGSHLSRFAIGWQRVGARKLPGNVLAGVAVVSRIFLLLDVLAFDFEDIVEGGNLEFFGFEVGRVDDDDELVSLVLDLHRVRSRTFVRRRRDFVEAGSEKVAVKIRQKALVQAVEIVPCRAPIRALLNVVDCHGCHC